MEWYLWRCATSTDFHLFQDKEEFAEATQYCSPTNPSLYLTSVDDIAKTAKPVLSGASGDEAFLGKLREVLETRVLLFCVRSRDGKTSWALPFEEDEETRFVDSLPEDSTVTVYDVDEANENATRLFVMGSKKRK